MHGQRLVAICLLLMMADLSLDAQAADWVKVAGFKDVAVDLSSIHLEQFPQASASGMVSFVNGQPVMTTYPVTWVVIGTIKVEDVFNCQGGWSVMQQVVADETPTSTYHNMDNTQAFKRTGVPFSDIPPDTVPSAIVSAVCGMFVKPHGHHPTAG